MEATIQKGSELLAYYTSSPGLVGLVRNHLPFLCVDVLDAKIKNRRTEEEQYLRNSELRSKLRRGNTIVKTLVKESLKVKDVVVARKGLPKFFDIRQSHAHFLRAKLSQGEFNKLAEETKLEFEVCFGDLKRHLEQGILSDPTKPEEKLPPPTASVFLLEKANGENAQVSFVSECDAWLVSSKNVSLLLRTTADLVQYSGERYEYALMIGQAWLEKVLPAAGSENLDKIKQLFSRYTAVGEYCGHPSLQHLVRYSAETIYFYALVDKNGDKEVCMPPREALNRIKEVGLPAVKIDQEVSDIKSVKQLGEVIAKLGQQVAIDNIAKSGEGGVLYLQKEGAACTAPVVTGLGKLKTMEYRILRKLREKLKGGIDHANNNSQDEVSKIIKKFMKEVRELAKECSFTDSPLGEEDGLNVPAYESFAVKAFKVLGVLAIDGEHLHNQYNSFLDLVNLCKEEQRLPTAAEITKFKNTKTSGGTTSGATTHVVPSSNFHQSHAQVNLLFPAGMLSAITLQQECKTRGFKFSLEYSQVKNPVHPELRLLNPNTFVFNPSNMKVQTYLVAPSAVLLAKYLAETLLDTVEKLSQVAISPEPTDESLLVSHQLQLLKLPSGSRLHKLKFMNQQIESVKSLHNKTKKIVFVDKLEDIWKMVEDSCEKHLMWQLFSSPQPPIWVLAEQMGEIEQAVASFNKKNEIPENRDHLELKLPLHLWSVYDLEKIDQTKSQSSHRVSSYILQRATKELAQLSSSQLCLVINIACGGNLATARTILVDSGIPLSKEALILTAEQFTTKIAAELAKIPSY